MTTFPKIFSAACIGVVLSAAPLLAQEVTTDYDHTYAFNKIKSYTYAKVQSADPLIEPRLTIAIDRVLQGQGLHLVSKNADIVISAIEATKDPAEYSTFYDGLSGYTWTRGWGSGGFTETASSPQATPVGTLVLDMYNPATNKLVWRGTAIEPPASKERKAEDNVDKAVNTMFAKFPPKSGGSVAPNQVEAPNSNTGVTPTATH